MAIIACGASVLTTIAAATIAMVASVPLTPILSSPTLTPGFNNMLPALFGGLVAQTIFKKKKNALLYLIPLAVCLILRYFTGINAAYYLLICVVVGGFAFYLFDYRLGQKPATVDPADVDR